jgi:hypothetical protein
MYKVTIQATPVAESNWRVVATGTWTPGKQPELVADQVLPAEIVTSLFDVTPSTRDTGRNQVQDGATVYAVVFRRLSK